MSKRILGLDLSLTATGWALVWDGSPKWGVIKSRNRSVKRLSEIRNAVLDIINPAEYLGKPCYVRLSVRQGDKPRADGTYPEFSNCEDVLGPDEARAIMAAQDRAAAGRGGASLPPRPADLPANNHMSATAGPPAEEDEIPF